MGGSRVNANISVISDTVSGKLNAARLLDIPLENAMASWLDKVIGLAVQKAPKDTGEMAGSLRPYTGSRTFPQTMGVKSDSRKFFFVHGAVTLPPPARSRTVAHWPPPSQSLTAWANRHGIPVFLVQKSIAEKGTPLIPFLSEAVQELIPELDGEIATAAAAVGKIWSS